MPKNPVKTFFPQAIYFDTNLLIAMSDWDVTLDYAELAQIAFDYN